MAHRHPAAGARPCARALLAPFAALLLGSLAGVLTPGRAAERGAPRAAAQAPAAQAGLVVRFGDGRVQTRCVTLPEAGLSGIDLLERSGLDLKLKVDGLGALVCSIDGEGCPRDDCLCRCRSGGADCVYWAYHQLEDDRWRYAATGAADRRLRPGDVDGWAWGPGSLTSGTQPPLLTLAEICAPPQAPTATPAPATPTATPTADPAGMATRPAMATRSAAPGPRVTATRRATATRRPSAAPPHGPDRTSTSYPSHAATLSPTPSLLPLSAEPTWAAQVQARMRLATLAAYATSLADLEGTAAARAGGGGRVPTASEQGADATSSVPPSDAPTASLPTSTRPTSTARSATSAVATRVRPEPAGSEGDAPAGGRGPALLLLLLLAAAWWRGRPRGGRGP